MDGYYGQNGIDQWMISFVGASAYDDPEIYVKLSPLTTIKQASTPTLIYVGERDFKCPASQSLQFWHGLKAIGVMTSLVVYPGEAMRSANPSLRSQRKLLIGRPQRRRRFGVLDMLGHQRSIRRELADDDRCLPDHGFRNVASSPSG